MTLRERRLRDGLSRQQVADVLGVTPSHYSRLELGVKQIMPRHLHVLEWRFGWTNVSGKHSLSMRRRFLVSSPRVHQRTQAEFLALMGMAAYRANGGEIPEDWRNWRRHPNLWARSIISASRAMRRQERGRAA